MGLPIGQIGLGVDVAGGLLVILIAGAVAAAVVVGLVLFVASLFLRGSGRYIMMSFGIALMSPLVIGSGYALWRIWSP